MTYFLKVSRLIFLNQGSLHVTKHHTTCIFVRLGLSPPPNSDLRWLSDGRYGEALEHWVTGVPEKSWHWPGTEISVPGGTLALIWHWALSASFSSETGHRSAGWKCSTPCTSSALSALWITYPTGMHNLAENDIDYGLSRLN